MRGLLIELGIRSEDQPVEIQEDNLGTKAIAENRKFSDRTKHIAIRHFRIQDEVENKTIRISACPTLKMAADIFTKPLSLQLFKRVKALVGVAAHYIIPRS